MKRLNRFSMIAAVVMLIITVCNMLMLSDMKVRIGAGVAVPETMGAAVAVILIAAGLMHLLELINLALQFRYFKNASMVRSCAFVIGMLSLFLLAVDVVMLRDIGNEYALNHDISGEWNIVFAAHAVHGLFAVLSLIQCAAVSKRYSKNQETVFAVRDESVFLTVHQTGVISAIAGFLCLFILTASGVPQKYLSGLLFFASIVILIPYALAVAYWLFTKRREKPAEWYDEKQFTDIARGALITLVFSALATIVFYCLLSCGIVGSAGMIWFPCYLFLSLLMFSGSTLFLNRRR